MYRATACWTARAKPPTRRPCRASISPCTASWRFTPLGAADYIDEIAKVWYMAQDAGLNPVTIHYATRIEGDVQAVFRYLYNVCEVMENAPNVHHYVLHFTMNCNSPTVEE